MGQNMIVSKNSTSQYSYDSYVFLLAFSVLSHCDQIYLTHPFASDVKNNVHFKSTDSFQETGGWECRTLMQSCHAVGVIQGFVNNRSIVCPSQTETMLLNFSCWKLCCRRHQLAVSVCLLTSLWICVLGVGGHHYLVGGHRYQVR